MLKELLKKVTSGGDMTPEEAFAMTEAMASGESPCAAAALLAVMSVRGESAAALTGCVRYLREHMARVAASEPCADIVGTGGDGGRSFNISTAAALAAAGAGVTVAKHGNRAVSSRCGAADVLEALGVDMERSPEDLSGALKSHHIAFLFARKLHPAMARVAPLRQELGIRTIFNLAGPLANPAQAEFMVAGVYRDPLVEVFAEALRNLGVKSALVVHSADGLDEISSLAPTHAALLRDGRIATMTIDPGALLADEDLRSGTLAGGDREENGRILIDVLSGRDRSAKRGAVLLNAAALCMTCGLGETLADCIPLAAKSIDSGAAMEKLAELRGK